MLFIILSVIICLLIAAALISATETAITASSPGVIQKMKSEGNKHAKSLLELLKIKNKVISTLLVGNSLANTLCTIMATSLFIEFLGDDTGTLVSSVVMSFVIIVFSEVVPKAIAVVQSERIALIATPILFIFLKLLEPINIFLSYIIKIFCLIFRIDLKHKISATDEVRGVIEHHMYEGNVVKNDRDMLEGILDLQDMVISDIMVHRSNIVAINVNLDPEKIINIILYSPYSRFPFWQNNHDNIIGILHIKDLLNKIHNSSRKLTDKDIRSLLSEPIFVPDNALVTHQLQSFKKGQSHLACVVDEYGDLRGITTLKDIIEEIVGQIRNEYDSSKSKIIKKSNNEYIIDGSMSIRDLNREFSWNISESDATTIAGLLMTRFKRIPSQGEYLNEQELKIIVNKKTNHRIKTVIVKVLKLNNESEK